MTRPQTLYRRALPIEAVVFSSPKSRELLAKALAAQEMEGYFPLAEQFHIQSDPSLRGAGSRLDNFSPPGPIPFARIE
jgi:glutathione gamma-glutamylcysteinyltransferase